MEHKHDWEVVVEEMGRRIVVADFSTEQSRFHKDTEEVMQKKWDFYNAIYKEADDVYIREKGSSIYRLAVEINGTKEVVPVADDMPLEVIYEHIQKVREIYRCYKVPATIWLEKCIYGQWVEYF